MARFRLRGHEPRADRLNRMTPHYMKAIGIIMGAIAIVCVTLQVYTTATASDSQPASRLVLSSDKCEGDTILPIIPGETEWNDVFRATLYLLFLCWLFLGVAISADVFMVSIETITSKQKTITVGTETVSVDVWNATVANLTLMALGSSAPEIMLAVIETISLTFEAGELGAGTIVGSAAFNLFFITAICIISLPPDEEAAADGSILENRKIEEFGVFMITAVASIWAYLSMVVFLEFISKDEVEMWEALFTILSFPALVFVSYAQDVGWWRTKDNQVAPAEHVLTITDSSGHHHRSRRPSQSNVPMDDLDKEGGDEETKDAGRLSTSTEAKELAAVEEEKKKKKKSRLEYRIQATRKMTGGKRVMPTSTESKAKSLLDDSSSITARIGFEETEYAYMESCGEASIFVKRTGNTDKKVSVQYDTSDCDAKAGVEYITTNGTLTFAPGETRHEIKVTIIDDDEWAPDKKFFVRLFNACHPDEEKGASPPPEMFTPTTQIIILNDDDPGKMSFDNRVVAFPTTATTAKIKINRTDGCSGTVLAFVKTIDGTALSGADFDQLEETEILFEHEAREAFVEVPLKASGNTNITFQVELTSVVPEGASIGDNAVCTVVISDDKSYTSMVTSVLDIMEEEEYGLGADTWMDQIKNAMNMEVEEGCEAGCMDYIIHAISFYWKILHALLPPANVAGGWPTFFCAIAAIGVITMLVGDTAKTFGCLVGLKDTVTAITFVALGTSLPDTFASMEATANDDTADAACGNVTGSNSVNVFLGLGLPWTLACIYHASKGNGAMKYAAGDLVFSVIVFTILAICTLLLLYVRRQTCGGELGGPKKSAYIHATILAGFWFFYVIISSLRTYGHLDF